MDKRQGSFDLVAVGELLIDFTPLAGTAEGHAFQQNAGGAPGNVLVMAARLGQRCAMLGKVGRDLFGRYLLNTLAEQGVETRGVVVDQTLPTTLAFVSLDERGERDFAFYRRGCADLALRSEELDASLLDGSRLFHFGSVSLSGESSRSATLAALRLAKERGLRVSFDPNYRPLLWESREEAQALMRQVLPLADVVKASDEEIALLTGLSNPEQAACRLVEDGAAFAFVTQGAQGCCFAAADGQAGRVPSFPVTALDSTGAGDAFCGAILAGLLDCGFAPEKGRLRELVRFANAAGALCTQRRGAIPAMPSAEEIRALCALG